MLKHAAIQDFKKRLRGQLLTIDTTRNDGSPRPRQASSSASSIGNPKTIGSSCGHRLSVGASVFLPKSTTSIWEYPMSLPRIPQLGLAQKMTKPHKRDLQRLVGRRIRLARKNAGLFQRELAERVGVSRSQITSVELGVSDTGFTVIIDIARAVGVKTRQLLP